MRVLRTIRGIIGTALAWTLPWAALGGALLVAYMSVRHGVTPFESLRTVRVNWILFRVGAEVSAVAGALAGSLFATILAVRGRHLTFAQLSTARLAAYGAIGGIGIGTAVVTVMASTLVRPAVSFAPLIGISAVLGAGSAAAMLQLARRQRPRPESASANSTPEPRLMPEAREGVERLLSAPDNLATLAADGRGKEARVRPPFK